MFDPHFSALTDRFGNFWPQIRILRVEISLEPAPELWNPTVESWHVKNDFLIRFFLNTIMGLTRNLTENCQNLSAWTLSVRILTNPMIVFKKNLIKK